MKRTFEFVEGNSSKFWHVELAGAKTVVSFGRIGTKGQTKEKPFPDEAAARIEFDKLIAEKIKKGYVETTSAPLDPLRNALEKALGENPDDLANHSAYADYLHEQGDPRGEFIQVQLALEDASLKPPQRANLQARERELLAQHGRPWLGPVAEVVREGDSYAFARGWLDSLSLQVLTGPASLKLAAAPELRLLRRLLIDDVDSEADGEWPDGGDPPDDFDTDTGCADALAASPFLRNVRVLRVGRDIDPDFDTGPGVQERAQGIDRMVAHMPRLEEFYLLVAHGIDAPKLFALPTLTNLRVLQLYHQHSFPFAPLGANPAVGNLTTLLCHAAAYGGNALRVTLDDLAGLCDSPHLKRLSHLRLRLTQLGDEGVRRIIASGLIDRLKILDLRLGSVTDVGARLLADCPAVRDLESINLSRNQLTADGIAALEAAGVPLNVADQHDANDWEWFGVGDYE